VNNAAVSVEHAFKHHYGEGGVGIKLSEILAEVVWKDSRLVHYGFGQLVFCQINGARKVRPFQDRTSEDSVKEVRPAKYCIAAIRA
jgi:hypothetical protein